MLEFFRLRNRKKERAIKAALPKTLAAVRVICYRKTDSTNTRAKAFASAHPGVPALILADEQTAGRGRLGRTFVSEKGGLYASFLLPSAMLAEGRTEGVLTETARAAVLTAEAIESLAGGVKPRIKWVNDLLVDGKKVAGILAEGVIADGGTLEGLVIGIGVNLKQKPFGGALASIAASIGDFTENPPSQTALAASLAARIFAPEKQEYIAAYRSRLLYVGKEVFLIPRHTEQGERERVTLLGVTDEGALSVLTEMGERRVVSSGEISLRPVDSPL